MQIDFHSAAVQCCKCSPMCQSAINGLLRLLGRNLVMLLGLRAMKIEQEWCKGKTSWMMARPLTVRDEFTSSAAHRASPVRFLKSSGSAMPLVVG